MLNYAKQKPKALRQTYTILSSVETQEAELRLVVGRKGKTKKKTDRQRLRESRSWLVGVGAGGGRTTRTVGTVHTYRQKP
jgi:hypothetical protein